MHKNKILIHHAFQGAFGVDRAAKHAGERGILCLGGPLPLQHSKPTLPVLGCTQKGACRAMQLLEVAG
jgi:hypothetical protein